MSLPWSTSATSNLLVLWLLALFPTLNVAMVRREVETAAGGLPVLLWLLAAVGMLWADVSWPERVHGLGGFHRLLMISFASGSIPTIRTRRMGPLWISRLRRDLVAWVLDFGADSQRVGG